MLAYLIHLPNDFKLYLSYLSKQKRDGRDATRARIKELKAYGYITINRERDGEKFSRTCWDINPVPESHATAGPTPELENPNVGISKVANPAEANPTLLNTKQKQELKIKGTTTTKRPVDKYQRDSRDLIYSAGLVRDEPKTLCISLREISLDDAQQLLDELATVMKKPDALQTNSICFLHGLLKKYFQTLFTPSAGLKIAKRQELDD
ncbi:hypothetical protein [Pseudomonas alabamensis]|uniref:hypothetical protein n=1 Tax=Pseudomonas alabamensis TaxID=3064349 RepID=UPI0021D7D847|nr:hypothetical protein [Pseudomonas entomophila]